MPVLPAPLRYALPLALLLAGCTTAPTAPVRDERFTAIAPVELAAAPADWAPYLGKAVRITAPLTMIDRDGGDGPWRSSDHDPLLLGFALRR